MEKEKYYTPTIEEFHVGFECEYNDPLKGSWEKVIYTEDMFFGGKRGLTLLEKRVKYLDREDIESLGFKLDKNASEKDLLNLEKDDIGITYKQDCFLIIYKFNRSKERIIFDGLIKNKSELKKLMYQLQTLP